MRFQYTKIKCDFSILRFAILFMNTNPALTKKTIVSLSMTKYKKIAAIILNETTGLKKTQRFVKFNLPKMTIWMHIREANGTSDPDFRTIVTGDVKILR